MPMYEFECTQCGHEFEELMKFAKQARMVASGEIWPLCPKCCGRTKKVMSSSNFKLNGYSEANGYS